MRVESPEIPYASLNTAPPAKSPKAGLEYEYWTMWPAPVHNSEFNHIYYNPRLTYEPPLRANGSSFPQMNAANTVNWTKVPADPRPEPGRSCAPSGP